MLNLTVAVRPFSEESLLQMDAFPLSHVGSLARRKTTHMRGNPTQSASIKSIKKKSAAIKPRSLSSETFVV